MLGLPCRDMSGMLPAGDTEATGAHRLFQASRSEFAAADVQATKIRRAEHSLEEVRVLVACGALSKVLLQGFATYGCDGGRGNERGEKRTANARLLCKSKKNGRQQEHKHNPQKQAKFVRLNQN